ncbi:MAG: carboxypeptidase-like regulatory domain-containing protein [Candidatus Edwardsbacteria bacterium]|nr:carboxypeptidase-like regulatory domain-containing protein [Candidatus Edwardsbacteria bacterium]
MKIHNSFIIALCLLAVSTLGCGPDAKRDNPLDPVNGSGVSGTVSAWGGGAVGNAVVSAVPANLSVRTNSTGQYNIELEGGRTYFLAASHPYYHSQVDTITVPSDGRLKHNFILKGVPRINQAKVLRWIVHTVWDGQLSDYVIPQCSVSHPDGEDVLERYFSLRCRINGNNYIPDSSRALDPESRKYFWSFLLNPLSPEVKAGDVLPFALDSAGIEIQSVLGVVSDRLEWPSIISPGSNSVFSPPDTMSWINNNVSVDVSVEIGKGTTIVWHRDLSYAEKLYCDAALEAGQEYLWKVINVDADGNQARTEAKFSTP